MTGLVVFAAGAISFLTARNIENTTIPQLLHQLGRDADRLASGLSDGAGTARRDILALASWISGEDAADLGVLDGVDPASIFPDERWRQRQARRLAAGIKAESEYLRLAIFSPAEGGRDVVRVERTGGESSADVAPTGEIDAPAQRAFLEAALAGAPGTVLASSVETAREGKGAAAAEIPVLRVAAPLHAKDGRRFGVLHGVLDLRPAFARLRAGARPFDRVFVVDERGSYLVHPASASAFGSAGGRAPRLQDDFPELASVAASETQSARVLESRSGERFALGTATVRLAGGPRVAVVVAMPSASLMAPVAAVWRTGLLVGAVAVLGALVFAGLLARSMRRPLVQMTRAVEAFGRGDAPAIPVNASGEIGLLARAFGRMAELLGEKSVAARRSAELLDKTLTSMSDGVLVLDPSGHTLFANPACKALFGDRFEIGSQEWQQYHHRFRPDGVTPCPPEETPVGRAVRGESFDNLEIICRRVATADTIRVVASGRVIRSEKGRYEGAVIVYRDLTELTEKTAVIRRNAEIFTSIMSSMADAVLLVDEEVRVVYANRAARKLLGDHADTGFDDWTGAYEIFLADGVTPLAAAEWPVVRAVRGEHVDNFGMAVRHRGAHELSQLVVTARPLESGPSGEKGAVMVFRDVTKFEEIERQLRQSQKMDAIGQLTGGVAHDFNNILTVITGTIEILADGVADRPKLAAITKLIDEAATRGSALTQQLLAFARRQALQPRRIDVNTMVLETTRLLRPTLGEHIEIRAMLSADVWPATIDPTQLSTALLNLAVNARDAMPDGGKLTIETANAVLDEAYAHANPESAPGNYVMIAVSDTGVGIPAAIRDKVFEPFYTTKETGKGTGLGLSMVYGFVKQSDGHVKIYSEEGYGTTIKVYLPRSDEPAADVDAHRPTPPPGSGERILVVEDDEMVRAYVVAQLESLGYATVAAANGADALARVDAGEAFDLLFTDVIMPGGMNGRQLADEVARRRPGTKVLYTSGYSENAIAQHGRLDAGIALLNKPYRKGDLARKIRESLDGGCA